MTDDEQREADWEAGFHVDANDKRWELDEMNYQHLRHTIALFDHLETGPLRKALRAKLNSLIPDLIDYLGHRESAARKKSTKSAKRRARLAKAARHALGSYYYR